MIDFSSLSIGKQYSRPQLAELWGYKTYNAISRGVVTPKNQKIIILFITKEKQESLTQYKDHIDEDILFWEGEKGHGSDERIIARQDDIHVFYRERHHSDFTYKGMAILDRFDKESIKPSRFVFILVNQKRKSSDIVAEIKVQYGLEETVRKALISARKGQGYYRKKSIELWGECSLTGFSKPPVLIASHIKPWKVSNNDDRINPYNSLLLVPTIDKLFDKGYIGFETNGRIMLSDKIDSEDYKKIHVYPELRLRSVPDKTKPYLEYHSKYVYDLVER